MHRNRVVVGGGVGALVAADSLARSGQQVDLYVPQGPLCGGFASQMINGRTLYMGLRLLELDYGTTTTPPALDQYRPGPTGHAPFIATIRSWIEELIDGQIFEATRPRLAFDGKVHEDIHVTADLSPLRSIVGDITADAIANEAQASIGRLGPAGMSTEGTNLWELDLETVSRANHGDTFHELLVEPLCRKFTGARSADVVAALRRKAWMPLYHPITVAEASLGKTLSYRPYRPFHVDSGGGCGVLIERLIERVVSNPLTTVRSVGKLTLLADAGWGRTRLAFQDGSTLEVARPIIGLSAEEVFSAAGIDYQTPRLGMHLIWLEIAESDLIEAPSTVLVGDANVPVIRVSGGGLTRRGARLFVVELARDLREPGASAAKDALHRCEIVAPDSPIEIVHELQAPILPAPTREAVQAHVQALEELANRHLDIELVGGALAPGADSLNEQILQGLAVGAETHLALAT